MELHTYEREKPSACSLKESSKLQANLAERDEETSTSWLIKPPQSYTFTL